MAPFKSSNPPLTEGRRLRRQCQVRMVGMLMLRPLGLSLKWWLSNLTDLITSVSLTDRCPLSTEEGKKREKKEKKSGPSLWGGGGMRKREWEMENDVFMIKGSWVKVWDVLWCNPCDVILAKEVTDENHCRVFTSVGSTDDFLEINSDRAAKSFSAFVSLQAKGRGLDGCLPPQWHSALQTKRVERAPKDSWENHDSDTHTWVPASHASSDTLSSLRQWWTEYPLTCIGSPVRGQARAAGGFKSDHATSGSPLLSEIMLRRPFKSYHAAAGFPHLSEMVSRRPVKLAIEWLIRHSSSLKKTRFSSCYYPVLVEVFKGELSQMCISTQWSFMPLLRPSSEAIQLSCDHRHKLCKHNCIGEPTGF